MDSSGEGHPQALRSVPPPSLCFFTYKMRSLEKGTQDVATAQGTLTFTPTSAWPLLLLSVFHMGFPGEGLFEKRAP